MSLQIFNTLSAKKEEFKPQNPPEIRMYTCGPTVYDFAHIGNFRTYVFQDLLCRYLAFKGFQVKRVMNITDVDDKTIAGAIREKLTLDEFTQKYTDEFHKDLKILNILPPFQELYATKTIPEMVDLIKQLIQKNNAYEKDGSVYFRISSFPKYGALSKKNLEGNIVGARVDQDEYEKEVGSDFALWKRAKEGEPSWDSPWGKGRPGWHIECSAMGLHAFGGKTLDIHTGGEDLIFPHHENEIAQSECATGHKFAVYWIHAKHLLVDGEKMSKSKGNFFTLRDLIKKGFDPIAIRYLLMSGHYRSQLNFTFDGLNAAKETLLRIQHFWRDLNHEYKQVQNSTGLKLHIDNAKKDVIAAMDDDLNVPAALAAIFELIKKANISQQVSLQEKEEVKNFLELMDQIFGVFSLKQDVPTDVQDLAKARQEAKEKKDFKKADEIRNQIKSLGFIITDTSGGVTIITPNK